LEPRTHETFCTIDAYGFVDTHDTLEDAEQAMAKAICPHTTHLYVGRFVPFHPRRLTLRQARWLWVGGVLAASVVLDVAENFVRWWLC
jgi:hypothetical protein